MPKRSLSPQQADEVQHLARRAVYLELGDKVKDTKEAKETWQKLYDYIADRLL